MVLFLYKNILTKAVMIQGGEFWRIINQRKNGLKFTFLECMGREYKVSLNLGSSWL